MGQKPEQTAKHVSTWWELDLPTNWSAHNDVECVTFIPNSDVGALQISCYKLDDNVTEEDLIEFSNGLMGGANRKYLVLNEFTGFNLDYIEMDTYWKKWWLKSGEIMFYVTYNCDSRMADENANDIELIMSTLKLRK
jgi:hypothetical protein